MANIGEAARAQPADDDDVVTDLTALSRFRWPIAGALPVCDALWRFRRGPAFCGAWRSAALGRALGCRMDARRVARTRFSARVRAAQLLAVLGVGLHRKLTKMKPPTEQRP
jgi:hypothetical protein